MKQLNKLGTFFLILIVFMTLPGCIGQEEKQAAPFSMQVFPEYMNDTIPGQRCVFLITVADKGEGSGVGQAVSIEASAPESTVTVTPQAITPGQVAEVTVIPEITVTPEEPQKNVTVTVEGEREGLTETVTVTLTVNMPMGPIDELEALATENRDLFIPWLAKNHPELGITSETVWTGTIVKPHILVVMYYLFFSDEWEMGLIWHVMIPPHDWVRIYLRHRTTELHPSLAFEISSKGEQDEPHAIDPKDAFAESVYR
ncbi:MAG: hypothetical protein ACFFDT_15035 [Candidatus Hodarchaeota archaeon]